MQNEHEWYGEGAVPPIQTSFHTIKLVGIFLRSGMVLSVNSVTFAICCYSMYCKTSPFMTQKWPIYDPKVAYF